MMRAASLSAWILIAACATAIAGTRTTVVYDQGTTACRHDPPVTIDGDRSTVEVSIEERQGQQALARKEIAVRASVDGKEVAAGAIKPRTGKLDAPLSFPASAITAIRVGDERSKCNFVVAAAAAASPPTDPAKDPAAAGKDAPGGPKDPSRAPAGEAPSTVLEQARQYLTAQGVLDHGRTSAWAGRTYRLYHLPDGSPAFPLPNKLSEEDRVELWAVSVIGHRVRAEITSCKDVPLVRVSGSRPEKLDPLQGLKGGGPPERLAFHMQRLTPLTRCAEQLSYKLVTDYGEREISIKIAPVYLFSWGLAYGFDFGRPSRLKLVERLVDGGMGEIERVIVRENDRTGLRPMVTLTLNACRANLDDWRACDWVGLTAMIDPGRLTEGIGLGVKVQPYPGLGVLLGVTMFQVDTLEPGHDLNVGDVFRETGDLKIDKEFAWKSLGLFLGVGGDTDTVKKLF